MEKEISAKFKRKQKQRKKKKNKLTNKLNLYELVNKTLKMIRKKIKKMTQQ